MIFEVLTSIYIEWVFPDNEVDVARSIDMIRMNTNTNKKTYFDL